MSRAAKASAWPIAISPQSDRGATIADNEGRLKDCVALFDISTAPDTVDKQAHRLIGHVDERVLGARQPGAKAADPRDRIRRI